MGGVSSTGHELSVDILALATLGKSDCTILNLGNGFGFSVKEVLEAARRVTKLPIPVKIKPRRPGDPARLVASSEKAKTTMGWRPQYPELDRIVASAWQWHQQRYCS